MFKKAVGFLLVISCVLTMSGCDLFAKKSNLKAANDAIAKGDYELAVNYLNIAKTEDDNSALPEIDEKLSIVQGYLDAKNAFDDGNYSDCAEYLDAIPVTYSRLAISDDIDALKKKAQKMGDDSAAIDLQIQETNQMIDANNFVDADANIRDLLAKNLTPEQKTNVDALNIRLSQQKNLTQTPAPAVVYQDNGDTSVKYYMYVVNVANSIYLRSQPVENDSNIIKTIPLGAQVGYISNCGNGFYKIMHNGNIGYAKQMYLSSYQSSPSASGDLTVVNVAHSIYLRSAPVENSSNIICEIPVGSKVKFVSGGTGEFYKISWNGYTGYAKSMYLRW